MRTRNTRNGQYAHKPGHVKRRGVLHDPDGAAGKVDLPWTDDELRALYAPTTATPNEEDTNARQPARTEAE